MQDLLAHLRPSLERLTEYEQAAQAVAAIEASEARSAASGSAGLGAIEEEDSDSDNSGDNSGSDSDAEGELPGSTSCLHNMLPCSMVVDSEAFMVLQACLLSSMLP